MSVLHYFGVVLLRSATMWGPFAAFYNVVKAFCCIVQRCGVVLGRSATMWCHFAPSCNDVVLIRQRRSSCSRVGPHSLENVRAALIWCRFAAFCNDVVSFCGVLQRFGAGLLFSAMIWCHFAAFCNDLVPSRGLHSLEHEFIDPLI